MPHPNSINPKTGKRFAWEAEQKALTAAEDSKKNVAEELALLARREAAIIARDDFMAFIKYTMPDPEDTSDITRSRYKNARHHNAIAKVIETFEKGELCMDDGSPCMLLILTMPPRHGKSEQVSRRLPAWYLGRHPEHDVVVATYNDDFAMDFGAEVRQIMASPQYRQVFPNVRLRKGGTAKDRLQTTSGGLAVFVGRGGSLTGRGAHLLIGDDLIKDDKEASSQAIRDQAWNWLTKVAMTRRRGRKLVILTFTRWHSDDPIGRLTDPENPQYSAKIASRIKIINLPAFAEEDDPLGRKPGEPLWPDGPDKFDRDFLEEQMALDPVGFASLYQQRPGVADGILFRRENIRRYRPEELPERLRYYCASDHALSTDQRRDRTCMGKGGIDTQDNLWLTQIFWDRVPSDRQVEVMLEMAKGVDAPLLWWAGKDHITKSIGPFLFKRMTETGIYINIREMSEIGDKEQKAQSIAARVAIGKVFIPIGPVWDRVVDEMLLFPNGTFDDAVDMLSLFGRGLRSQFGAAVLRKEPERPKFGTMAWVKEADKWKADQERAAKVGGF